MYVELSLVKVTHHCCPEAGQCYRDRIDVYSVTIPLMSSKTTRSQGLETNAGVALTAPLDCLPKMTLLPPPLGNFADIVYLKEQSFLHRIRDVCTL